MKDPIKLSKTAKALLVEAHEFGHAEARGSLKAKAAVSLRKQGLFLLGGGSTGGFRWYRLTEYGAEVARVVGAS